MISRVFPSAGSAHPRRSPRPWCFSRPTTAATSREPSCSWMAVSPRCRPNCAGVMSAKLADNQAQYFRRRDRKWLLVTVRWSSHPGRLTTVRHFFTTAQSNPLEITGDIFHFPRASQFRPADPRRPRWHSFSRSRTECSLESASISWSGTNFQWCCISARDRLIPPLCHWKECRGRCSSCQGLPSFSPVAKPLKVRRQVCPGSGLGQRRSEVVR